MSSEEITIHMVKAISAVMAIGDQVPNDHPMRHHVRSLKHRAETILSEACRSADGLAMLAKQVVADYDKVAKKMEPLPDHSGWSIGLKDIEPD